MVMDWFGLYHKEESCGGKHNLWKARPLVCESLIQSLRLTVLPPLNTMDLGSTPMLASLVGSL